MLWKSLKWDDFDTDIIEVLRESNNDIREQLVGLSRDDLLVLGLNMPEVCEET